MFIRSRQSLAALAGAVILTLASVNAFAVTQTVIGTNFDVVYDDSQGGLTSGKYSAPLISGNNIIFSNSNFITSCADAGCNNPVEGTVDFTIVPKNGFTVESLFLAEQGRYKLNGATASVAPIGSLDVGDALNGLFGASGSGGIAAINTFVDDNTFRTWNAVASVSTTGQGSSLLGPVDWNTVSQFSVSIINQLVATTDAFGDTAVIEKLATGTSLMLGVNQNPNLNPVPIPGAIWLFGSGLLGLVGVARKRKQE